VPAPVDPPRTDDRESPPVLGVLVFVVVAAVSLGTAVAMRRRRGVAVD
jgi:hypothetical protein